MTTTKSRNGRKSTPTPDLIGALSVSKKRGRPPKVRTTKSRAQMLMETEQEIAKLQALAELLR
jgi:hypothetical protein